MARRVAGATFHNPGPDIRAHLIEKARRRLERYPRARNVFTGEVSGYTDEHVLHYEQRVTPIAFQGWEVRTVWPDAALHTTYYLDPDDTIREAVKDGDTWK